MAVAHPKRATHHKTREHETVELTAHTAIFRIEGVPVNEIDETIGGAYPLTYRSCEEK